MKKSFTLSLLLLSASCFSQTFFRPGEEVIFSFETTQGKQAFLIKEKANKYIVYRFGTSNKVEFQFPAATSNSWQRLRYAFWLRGGGKANDGLDLNYVIFENNGFRYVIYDTYESASEKSKTGIRVIDLKTNKATNIKGIYKTRKGTLTDFRSNGLLTVSEEIFE